MEENKVEMIEATKKALRNYGTLNQQDLEPELIEEIAQAIAPYFEIVPLEETQSQTASDERQVLFENEGGIGGAASIKAGNIIVNWKEALEFMSNFVMTSAGVASQPWLLPFAAISSIQSAHKVLRIEIQEKLAMVLWVISMHPSLEAPISTESILEIANSEYPRFNRPQMTRKELEIMMEELEGLRCIERIERDLWRLREKGVIRLSF